MTETQPKPTLIIGLVGLAGSGKSTATELIHDMKKPCFVIVDVREKSEVDAIRAQGGVIWRIERPGLELVRAHVSEAAMVGVEADRVIRNEGTLDDLQTEIKFELARACYEKGLPV